MTITMISAMTENHQVMGSHGRIPWSIKTDLAHFKRISEGQVVLMGRKTWESLPIRPLPHRVNLVMSHNRALHLEGAYVVPNTIAALDFYNCIASDEWYCKNLIVMGGAQIYQEFLSIADDMYITHVHTSAQGDTFFPTVNWSKWVAVSACSYPEDEGLGDDFSFTIVRYVRDSRRL